MYDKVDRKVYDLGNRDFAGGAAVDIPAIVGPAGKKGRVVGMAVQLTEAVVGTSTAPTLIAGSSAGDDSYGALTLATGTAVGALVNEDSEADALPDFVSGIASGNTEIPTDGSIYCRCTLAAGGSITGQGNVQLTVDWY